MTEKKKRFIVLAKRIVDKGDCTDIACTECPLMVQQGKARGSCKALRLKIGRKPSVAARMYLRKQLETDIMEALL